MATYPIAPMSVSAQPTPTDQTLWHAARSGDLEAFGRIVERYQSLVASIAYSRTGNLAVADDVAQETFVAAWRSLDQLREPGSLKSWLAGIARNLTANAARRESRQGGTPLALDEIAEPVTREASPEARAVSKQEEELLWNTLAQLPENYREPLLLFYREERSVAEVAAQLELTQEVVRQRLSRGRNLLRDDVTALVESALTRSRPGPSFTAGVLAAIAVTAPASAGLLTSVATSASASASAAGAAKGTGMLGGMGGASVAGPVAGLATAWLAGKLAGRTARSGEERRLIARGFRRGLGFTVPMIAMVLALVFVGTTRFAEVPSFLAISVTLWTVALVGGLIAIAWGAERGIHRLRREGGVSDAEWAAQLARRGVKPSSSKRFETRARLLGLPLFAYASGGVDAGAAFDGSTWRGARGWIAFGDLALSPLLAIGGVAIAPVAIGGVTIGLVSLSVGGIALGAFAVGSLAFGWMSYGIISVAWKAAAGVTAIARDYAVGPQASALEANTDIAAAFVGDAWFTPVAALFGVAVPVLVALAIVIPMALMARRAWVLRRIASEPFVDQQAASMAPETAPGQDRLHGLDALRSFALLLGVVLHAAMPFVLPPGFWAIGTLSGVPFLGWLAFTIHSFRMETFFLLAGFFGSLVVARRGVRSYLGDRWRRIVLVFLAAIVPMKVALSALWIAGGRATGWLTLPPEHAHRPLWQLALGSPMTEKFPDVSLTHLWFLYYLAIVTGLFLGARAVIRRFSRGGGAPSPVTSRLSGLLAHWSAPLAFTLSVTPILAQMTGMDIDTPDRSLRWHFPVLALYLLFFAIGWGLEQRRELFAPLARRWKSHLALGLLASLPASAIVGWRYSQDSWVLAHATELRWGGSFATALTMVLLVCGALGLFLRWGARPRPLVGRLAEASYFVYLAHLPLVVALQLALRPLELRWWMEVPVVSVVTVLVLLVVDQLVVRSTWIGSWLNGRRR